MEIIEKERKNQFLNINFLFHLILIDFGVPQLRSLHEKFLELLKLNFAKIGETPFWYYLGPCSKRSEKIKLILNQHAQQQLQEKQQQQQQMEKMEKAQLRSQTPKSIGSDDEDLISDRDGASEMEPREHLHFQTLSRSESTQNIGAPNVSSVSIDSKNALGVYPVPLFLRYETLVEIGVEKEKQQFFWKDSFPFDIPTMGATMKLRLICLSVPPLEPIKMIQTEIQKTLDLLVAEEMVKHLRLVRPTTKTVMDSLMENLNILDELSSPNLTSYSLPLSFLEVREGRKLFQRQFNSVNTYSVACINGIYLLYEKNKPGTFADAKKSENSESDISSSQLIPVSEICCYFFFSLSLSLIVN